MSVNETRRECIRHPTSEQIRAVCEALKGVRVGAVTHLDSRFRDFMRVVHPASVLELLDKYDTAQQLITQLTEALELTLATFLPFLDPETEQGQKQITAYDAAYEAVDAASKEREG